MITQLWGLSKRTLSKKGNLAVPLHMEPSKFLAEFRSSAKKESLPALLHMEPSKFLTEFRSSAKKESLPANVIKLR